MAEKDRSDRTYGPLWQCTENARTKRIVADQFRADAAKLIKRADEAMAEAALFERAAESLKAAGFSDD